MSLLQTAEALWQEAYRCLDSVPRITPSATLSPSHSSLLSPLSSAPSAPSDGEHLAALQRASQYLHAGLELVLPTALELRFRLLLARLLLQHTEDGDADAREHLRKCLQLVKSVPLFVPGVTVCSLIHASFPVASRRLSTLPQVSGRLPLGRIDDGHGASEWRQWKISPRLIHALGCLCHAPCEGDAQGGHGLGPIQLVDAL